MSKVLSRPALLAIAVVGGLAAAPAFAMGELPSHPGHGGPGRPHGPVTSAPEIDAGSGLAAMAAVLAGLALAWERRRSA